jgi:hypothetical protein
MWESHFLNHLIVFRTRVISWTAIVAAFVPHQLSVGIALSATENGAQRAVVGGWQVAGNELRVSVQRLYVCCGLTAFNVSAGVPCPTDPLAAVRV